MSTRATFTFADRMGREFHVYKHHDGYPQGAAVALSVTLLSQLAWPLPRYEADELAAAFVAANKIDSGGIRLAREWDEAMDIEFHYRITQEPGGKRPLIIQVFEVTGESRHTGRLITRRIWSGPVSHFLMNEGAITDRKELA